MKDPRSTIHQSVAATAVTAAVVPDATLAVAKADAARAAWHNQLRTYRQLRRMCAGAESYRGK